MLHSNAQLTNFGTAHVVSVPSGDVVPFLILTADAKAPSDGVHLSRIHGQINGATVG